MELSIKGENSSGFRGGLSILLMLIVLLVIVSVILCGLNIRNGLRNEKRIETCRVTMKEIQERQVITPIDKAAADAALSTALTLCSQVLQ